MNQRRNRTHEKARPAFIIRLTLASVTALLLSGRMPVSRAYNADATTAITGLRTHSSFHYEMVRVLAVLAGFEKKDAEEIAVACEAVDLGRFTGYRLSTGARTVVIRNTGRFGPNGLLYHFARRSAQYRRAEASGARGDTCEYFKDGNPNKRYTAPCASTGPELDQIKNWAFNLGTPKPSSSQLPLNALSGPVMPGSRVALGIYLHSIGDTYSHEKCMIDQAWRFHKPNPFSCNADWHTDVEGDFGDGAPFAKAAAAEVWKALHEFQKKDVLPQPPFIDDFIAIKDACERVKFAVDRFNSLTQETTSITCPPLQGAAKVQRARLICNHLEHLALSKSSKRA